VAMDVVHFLEPVQIQVGHRIQMTVALCPGLGHLHAVRQELAVREPHKGVMIGHLADRLHSPDPVRNVLGLTDEVVRFSLPVPHQGGGEHGPEDPPVLVDVSFLLPVAFNFTLEEAHRLFDLLGDVIRMGDLLKIHPEKFLFRITEHLDHGGIDENKFSLQVHCGNDGAGMLNHHPEARFAFSQFLFQTTLVGDVPQDLDGADDLSHPVVNRSGLGPEKSSFLPGERHIPLGADYVAVPVKIIIIVLPRQLGIEDVINQQGALFTVKGQGVDPVALAQFLFPVVDAGADGEIAATQLPGPFHEAVESSYDQLVCREQCRQHDDKHATGEQGDVADKILHAGGER